MKHALLVLTLLLMSGGVGPAAQQPDTSSEDKTLSPYFFVRSDDPAFDQLPLKATSASVEIVGIIARVTVAQEYANEGKRAIEAVYVFPGSTRAAVHAMKMRIGDRTLTARIEERQEARRQYEGAKQAGQTASLLEQQRPNVFQMNVANILPGDRVSVELVYTELLVPENGIYEFVYPTVVGPRYTRSREDTVSDTGRWVQNPYLHQGEAPPYRFDLKATVASGMPLRDVTSPSHDVKVDFPSADRARVSLVEAGGASGNRDFVLRYRLADNRIETGVLAGSSGGENFFVLMVEPPARVAPVSVPPREYLFIMDVSGSMNGFPIETSKELLSNVLDGLGPDDYFNVLFFSGGSFTLSPVPLQATDVNKRFAKQEVARQHGSGGTELLPALQNAFAMPRAREDMSRAVVIATDGYVDVEREAFELIRAHMDEASVFTFGIGSSVNRYLLEGMARIGEGLPFIVLDGREAPAIARRFLRYIESPLLTRIDVAFSGFDTYDLEPARVPDLFAERPLVITGKYRGAARGTIRVTGFTGQGRFERTLEVSGGASGEALKYLWARERLSVVSDFASVDPSEETRKEVTALGLQYGLLTAYTSFVAVDERVRRTDGKVETVKQPLPLPQGVSDLAVGGPGRVGSNMAGGVAGGAVGGVVGAAPSAQARTYATESLAVGDAARSAGVIVVPAPGVRRAVEVAVVANRLVGAGQVTDAKLASVIGGALGGVSQCFAGLAPRQARLVRIHFDGAGHVDRVQVLEQERWKDQPSFIRCIEDTIRKSLVLPWRAGGEVEIRMTIR
ncbi:MAG: VIT domain-containing protein [Vicinamibacterales bacterium]